MGDAPPAEAADLDHGGGAGRLSGAGDGASAAGDRRLYPGGKHHPLARQGSGDGREQPFILPSAAWRPQPSRGDSAAPLRLGPTACCLVGDRGPRLNIGGRPGSRRLILGAAIRHSR
jgi:hypothetical protein